MGQKTTSSPDGRDQYMGQPMKMAELIAGLDGPVYVERVALYDPKQQNKARKAIQKALTLQVERRGFSFVEVLAECPTHLKLTPVAAEAWVRDSMVPDLPARREEGRHPRTVVRARHADLRAEPTCSARSAAAPARAARFCTAFPSHIAPDDISLKLAGSGGDGAQTAAMLIARAGINEGFDATHIPSYGPESRGGTSYADVHVAATEVLSPAAPNPHVLVAFNAPSLERFAPTVRPGGIVIYDSSVIEAPPPVPAGVTRLRGARSPASPPTSASRSSRTSSRSAPCRPRPGSSRRRRSSPRCARRSRTSAPSSRSTSRRSSGDRRRSPSHARNQGGRHADPVRVDRGDTVGRGVGARLRAADDPRQPAQGAGGDAAPGAARVRRRAEVPRDAGRRRALRRGRHAVRPVPARERPARRAPGARPPGTVGTTRPA